MPLLNFLGRLVGIAIGTAFGFVALMAGYCAGLETGAPVAFLGALLVAAVSGFLAVGFLYVSIRPRRFPRQEV